MPELPEVETVRRGLEKHVVGKLIKAVRFAFPKIAEVNLLIELNVKGRDYTDIKDELVTEIAKYNVSISEFNNKTATP